jgi:hypothetical protein
MRSWASLRRPLAGALAAGVVAASLGCGKDEERDQPVPPEPPVNLPKPSGRSFREVLGHFPGGPVVAPGVNLLEPGENRFGFALFDRGNRQIGGLQVGLYVARGVDEAAHGPFVAKYNKIDVKPQFRSRTSSEDPDSARSIYVARVDFDRPGTYLVSAVTRLNGRLVAAQPAQMRVSHVRKVPGVGDRAPRVHTPTVESVGGDIGKIETRVPPDSMHEVDLANALDKGRPVVLLFSSPALCESRVCGPVTDVTEEVKSEFDKDVDFIHVEFYEDNEVAKGPREAARVWGLSAEPFVFTIDKNGIVAARIQGAFSADELRDAVRRALR